MGRIVGMNFLQDLPDFVQYSRLDATFALEGQQQFISHPSRTRRQAGRNDDVWVHTKNLGEGAQGSVALQTKKSRRAGQVQHRAVKRIRVLEGNIMFNKLVLRELEAIFTFSQVKFSDLFVKSHAWYTGHDSIFIAMEYHELGDLGKYLQDQNRCPTGRIRESEVNEITSQVLNALALMHENGFSHRDLKPENILIEQEPPGSWVVKVGDFGISKKGSEVSQITATRGTATYIAPELVFNDGSGPSDHPYALDMWALGATVFKLLTGKAMFTLQSLAFYSVSRSEFPKQMLKDVGASDEAIAFVSSLATVDAKGRPTSDEALDHPWMEQTLMEDTIADSVPEVLRVPGLGHSIDRDHSRPAAFPEQHDQSLESPIEEDPEYTAMWPDQLETVTVHKPLIGQSHEFGRSYREPVAATVATPTILATPITPVTPATPVTTTSASTSATASTSTATSTPTSTAASIAASIAASTATSTTAPIKLPQRAQYATLTRQMEEEGDIHFNNQEYEKAESIYTDLVESREKNFGAEHLKTVVGSYKLANSLFEQGKFEQAETIYRKVVEVRERKLGDVRAETLAARSKLGMAVARIKGREDEGQAILRDVFSVQKDQLTEEQPHPDTLEAMADLAAILQRGDGNVAEARKILAYVVQKRTKVLGDKHEKTLESANALMDDLEKRGNREELSYSELTFVYWPVMIHRSKLFGDSDPRTISVTRAILYNMLDQDKKDMPDQDKHEEGRFIYQGLMLLLEQALGEDDWSVLECRYDLAEMYREIGDKEGATESYNKIVQLAVAKDERNPLTSKFMKALCIYLLKEHCSGAADAARAASSYIVASDEYEEVVKMLESLVYLLQKTLGKSHKDTSCSMESLAKALAKLGGERAREAEPFYRDVLRISEEQNGADHRETLYHMRVLAVYLSDREEPKSAKEAINILQKLIPLRRKTMPEDIEGAITEMYCLVKPLLTLERHEDAADNIGQIYSLWETTDRGLADEDMPTANHYALVLEILEKYDKLAIFLGYILRYEQKTFGADDPKTLGTAARIKTARKQAKLQAAS